MRTHPWLVARAEYLASHAPVIDRPSVLGIEELERIVNPDLKCAFPHGVHHPEESHHAPEGCSVEVVANVGCLGCRVTYSSCENVRAYIEAMLQSPGSPVCVGCKAPIRGVWWTRLI